MKKVLKWVGIVLGGMVGLIAVAAITLYVIGSARLSKTYDIRAEAIAIPNDEAALARGRHLAEAVAFCTAATEKTWAAMFRMTTPWCLPLPLPT